MDFPGIRRLFRLAPRNARDAAREVDDEITTHLALRVEYLVARGIPEDEAWAVAHRRFGNWPHSRGDLVDSARRREGRIRLRESIDGIRQDIGFALRQLRRAPVHALFAILTLAIAIGLTTTVFAAVNGILLRPLPYRQPDRLVRLRSMDSLGHPVEPVSDDNWNDWRHDNHTMDGIAIYMARRFPIFAEGDAVRVAGEVVSPNFFRVVGSRLLFGREFTDGEAPFREAIVSERLWRRALNGRRTDTLSLQVSGRPMVVIGVVASGQEFPEDTDIWLPAPYQYHGGAARNNINWTAVGRLAPGVSVAAAQADLTSIALRIHRAEPEALYSWGVPVTPLQDDQEGAAAGYLPMLLGAVGLLLLIACANLASANLARGAARAREMAIRAAIGATRRRIVRQLLVEHLVLALMGGAAGLLLALALTRALALSAAAHLPRAEEIQVDGRVALFAFVVSASAGILAGLLPARQASRDALTGPLAEGGRGGVRGGRGLPGQALVAVEIALAVILVAGAGLLVQSFRTLLARSLGFETRGVAVAAVTLNGARYFGQPSVELGYWRTLLTTLRDTPGVAAAGAANWIPLGTAGSSFIEIAGKSLPEAGAGYRVVTDGYFAAMGIPLLRGRAIQADDDPKAIRVCDINRAMAERYWPGENPIGKLVRASSMEGGSAGHQAPWLTVVGVVDNVRQWGYATDATPEMYVAYAQLPDWIAGMNVVVRSAGGAAAPVAMLRRQIHALDPELAADIEPLALQAERSTAGTRFIMNVLTLFGVLALLLAAIGVYGVLALSVAQRTRELAVRAALGADRQSLLEMVLAAGLRVIVAGTAVGLVATWFATKLMESLLFQVRAHDPLVLALSTVTIVVAGLLAALVPAWRATRVDPIVALQAE
ncbi:MAG TPA: ABC transporter permease [Gemmatimonadales bacterium]|jgi:predicted permease